MKKDWTYLSKLTNNKPITIQRVKLENEDIAIEGNFELPPLAKLSSDDQVFIAAFVKCHGSIKEMEKHFNISYPTVKNRLNRIGQMLEFVEIKTSSPSLSILEQLERGEINTEDAIKLINKGEDNE